MAGAAQGGWDRLERPGRRWMGESRAKERSNRKANPFFCAWRPHPWNSENPRVARPLRFASSAKSAPSRADFAQSPDRRQTLQTVWRSGPDSNSRFHLSGAKTADFFEFVISEESHRPRRLASVLRNSSKSCQGRGTGGSNSVRSLRESQGQAC